MRKPSEKAKRAYFKLCYETSKTNAFCRDQQAGGRDDGWFKPDTWSWANEPMMEETLNMLLDIKQLVDREIYLNTKFVEYGVELVIGTPELEIVKRHVEQRIETYRR